MRRLATHKHFEIVNRSRHGENIYVHGEIVGYPQVGEVRISSENNRYTDEGYKDLAAGKHHQCMETENLSTTQYKYYLSEDGKYILEFTHRGLDIGIWKQYDAITGQKVWFYLDKAEPFPFT